jgi:hypothetical protein
VRPKRDRRAPYVYAFAGQVRGAFVADSATCTGKVTVTVHRGTKLLQRRGAHLDSGCRYHTRIRLTSADLRLHHRARLTAKVQYAGTANLTASHTTAQVIAH